MNQTKVLVQIALLVFILIGAVNCSGSKHLSKKTINEPPLIIENPYYQEWIAGVQGGGSGINIFLPTQDKQVILDSAFFRGMKAKVQLYHSGYIARFITNVNQREDFILSSEPQGEYGNQLPEKAKQFPFELQDNACALSYIVDDKSHYFMIDNLEERPIEPYPQATPNP